MRATLTRLFPLHEVPKMMTRPPCPGGSTAPSARVSDLALAGCAALLATLLATLLSGCAVGPEYARPTLPESVAFSPAPLPPVTASTPLTGGAAQRFVLAQDIRADWWGLFRSPALNTLIERAFAANPSVEAAQAALRVAQENVYAQRGFFYPTVQGGYSASRTKLAGNLGGNSPGVQEDGSVISTTTNPSASQGGSAPFNAPVIYNFHTAQLSVGYVPDVFGGNRRQFESLQAQTELQQLQVEATYLTLASNVVAAAIQDALLRQQIATTRALVDASASALDIVRRQHVAGLVSRLDVANQQTALAQARQLLAPLQKQFEQNRNLLRALVGGVQDRELPEAFVLSALVLPEDLPLSLPSQVVERRPDIRAAEAQLKASSALIGVAQANRLPQFSIEATAGGAAARLVNLFGPGGRSFNLAANIALPIFDGGTLRHRARAAEENFKQAAAQYQSTVITAFQNVADTLQAIYADANAQQAAAEVHTAAQAALALTERQHALGYIDRLVLINAQRTVQQATLDLAQAQAARLGDTAALFQALGGGWWQRNGTAPGTQPRSAATAAH